MATTLKRRIMSSIRSLISNSKFLNDIVQKSVNFSIEEQVQNILQHSLALKHICEPATPLINGKRHENFTPNSVGEILISIGWTIDASDKLKSSKKSVVPILGVVNQLPEALRNNPAFMVIIGIVVCKGKPPPHVYLRSMVDEMKKLDKEGG
jgi:hypothetical protein